MTLYRKRPVVVEAMQYTGDNLRQVTEFCPGLVLTSEAPIIQTLEGDHTVSVGDFIIKGVAGEFYPCKPDIFEQTYEAAE